MEKQWNTCSRMLLAWAPGRGSWSFVEKNDDVGDVKKVNEISKRAIHNLRESDMKKHFKWYVITLGQVFGVPFRFIGIHFDHCKNKIQIFIFLPFP